MCASLEEKDEEKNGMEWRGHTCPRHADGPNPMSRNPRPSAIALLPWGVGLRSCLHHPTSICTGHSEKILIHRGLQG
jgi:hypothetical protein